MSNKAEFTAHFRELIRPDMGDDADIYEEIDFVSDLAEDGWPDHEKWMEIWYRLYLTNGELTEREREQSLAYWHAGEDYPAEEIRLK